MHLRYASTLCLLVVLAVAGEPSVPDAVHVPPDAGIIDVRLTYGAKGDGRSDDTAAIQKAITDHLHSSGTVYLPPGTYLVSGTLDWIDKAGNPNAFLALMGAGRGKTTIRLKDACPGFNDPTQPKAVVMTRSQRQGGNDGSNQAHANYLFDLAVDVGSGNPGAIGVDFMASNTGSMVRVDVRAAKDSGAIGVAMTRGFGPGLVRDVRVTGFATGIKITGMIYSAILERIRLEGQSTVGLDTVENTVSVRKLVSVNRCVAVRQHANQPLTGWLGLLDCSFTGGEPGSSAIENAAHLLVRDLSVGGYGQAISSGSTTIPGPAVAEWTSSAPTVSPLGGGTTTLHLPVVESPDFFEPDLNKWASPVTFGAVVNDRFDDSEALQQAIDSGANTIYLPHGSYHLSAPVVVRGKVRRIIGYSARIIGKKPGCVLRVEDTAGPVIIERIDFAENTALVNAAAKNLVAYRYGSGRIDIEPQAQGWLFDDVCAGPVALGKGQKLYGRQFNNEAVASQSVERNLRAGTNNLGGLLWVLGLKTEGGNTGVLTTAGGRSEILGAHVYACQQWSGPRRPAFVVEDGQLSAGVALICHWGPANYDLVLQHHVGTTRQDIPGGGHAVWPLLNAGQP